VLAGGNPDFRKIAPTCTESRKSLDCQQFRSGDIPSNPPREPRIRAAVLADTPLNYMFTQEGLAEIQIPLQIWRSELGGGNVDPKNTALTADRLPGKPDVRVMPAGHFAFLAPCSPQFAANVPRLCADPPGFDRTAFHRDFDASLVGFLRAHLTGAR
jgi:predicted dienelactone hydrolase